MQQILVVSGETSFIHRLTHRMAFFGIEVLAAQSGEQALETIHHHSPELVLLSEPLPDFDVNEVCRLIRAEGYTEMLVILLHRRGALRDILAGLESGVDSVLPWPLPEDELVERIRARLRYEKSRAGGNQHFQVGSLVFDAAEHQVWCNGQNLQLSKREYELLKLLVSNAGRVLPKEVIFERIWGPASTVNPETIKVYINKLRKKLNACGESNLIHAVRSIGYTLRP